MAVPTTPALLRLSGSPLVRRALLVFGLSSGLWLVGTATSSASADVPPPAAPVQGIVDLTGDLLAPVPAAVTPVVAPVVDTALVPVAQTPAPVGERLVAPVLRAVEPVTAPVVGALAPVLDPVVASFAPVLQPVMAAVPPVLAPLAPVRPVPQDEVQTVRATAGAPAAADARGGSAAGGVPAPSATGGEVTEGTSDGHAGVPVPSSVSRATVASAPAPGGDPVPAPAPVLPAGAPAPSSSAGSSSSLDQPAGDLPPAAFVGDLGALGTAADGGRDGAADRALDPAVPPD
ncbi:hypothetical protein JKP75_12710 [Blastococcus sp. TML/M2B]|uniref:hypothetical protein n=1 Tax=unclassified Blastococcus TaxID=2619396 RepID=UPI00190B80E8|nr:MULTISPECIES: hypothetical protein [unclassified Blastococcus]MBN1093346.1 hypothetical protein [Blastococcus sp. TML/M2B]MBN1096539.1 hypothetical protein [Blastococcus sp. TML/C7B]